MRALTVFAPVLLLACGPKSGGTDAQTWLDIGLGAPKLCLPTVPSAGPLKKEAEVWEAGVAALRTGDVPTAHEALLPETEHPAVDVLRTVVSIMAQDGAGAWDRIRPIADAWPEDPCLDQVASLAAMQAGQSDAAIALADRALRGAPSDPEIGLTRSLFLLQQGRRDEAVAALEGILLSSPDHVGAAFSLAVVHLEEGDLEGAVPLFEVAERGGMDLSEDLTRMYFLVGRRADYLRRASEALWPIGDEQAISKAEDPEAAYLAHLGMTEGQELHAVLQTSMGDIDCTLFPEDAPVTVANFVGLARGTHPFVDPDSGSVVKGPYYEGTVFHRVIPDFMVQAGDPTGVGSGGPGYQFPDEISADHHFDGPGVLAMANSGPDSNGSQFFVTDGAANYLDGMHTIFGSCDEAGQAVVHAIASVERGQMDKPVADVILEGVRVEAR